MPGGMARPLYLNDAVVSQSLPDPALAVQLVDTALRAIAGGEALLRHDVIRPVPGVGFSAIFGAVRGDRWLAGQKWVAETIAGVAATLILNDGATGALECVMDARALTGLRTAAVSGACIAALARDDGPTAIIGTGLQCRWHLRVLAALGRRRATIAFRRAESAAAVRAWAAEAVPDMDLTFTDSIEQAVRGASIIVSMVTRGATGTRIAPGWIAPNALLLPVDFAHCIGGDVASGATVCAADDLANYRHERDLGELPGYPDAGVATGTLLAAGRPDGLIVIQNMGNAACDLAIAAAVLSAARAVGAGIALSEDEG